MSNKRLRYKPYLDQLEAWPEAGRAVVLHYNADSVVLYDACRPAIAEKSVSSQRLTSRSADPDKPVWLKLSFLHTMARSNWGAKNGQEHVLAHWVERTQFEGWLHAAVHSKYLSSVYDSQAAWEQQQNASDVLLEWSPDNLPNCQPTARRTLQLGLRRAVLAGLNESGLLHIADISGYAKEQADYMRNYEGELLLLPYERVFPVKDVVLKRRLGLGGG